MLNKEKGWEDNDIVILSMLSQYGYCKRRAFLLLSGIENVVNNDVAEGVIQHDNVHTKHTSTRNGIRSEYELNVHSYTYGINGKCDLVEFHENDNMIIPVEYKHGVTRNEIEYEYQLCGQVLCLEEMYNTTIDYGYVFYTDSHRRKRVDMNQELRDAVKTHIKEIRLLQNEVGKTYIAPIYSAKCKKCSMYDMCMPKMQRHTKNYIEKMWDIFNDT